MKIGLYTDGLPALPFTAVLDWAASHGIETIEVGTGNFSSAPHCDLQRLHRDKEARQAFQDAIQSRNLKLSALNCNGNLLDPHPVRRKKSQETFFQTIEVASQIGLDTVVTMSGCPGDPTGGSYPNWVTCVWQPEFAELAERQWAEQVEPFWRRAARVAADHGVKIALEMHPGQVVHNTRTLLRLREIGGAVLGANLDPSHLFWQGMDPVAVVRALGQNVVFHVHAKDTGLVAQEVAVNGVLDLRPINNIHERSWAFRTVGFGHSEAWWREFIYALRLMGYDGPLSIEHEDPLMGTYEGILKSVEFLKPIILEDYSKADVSA